MQKPLPVAESDGPITEPESTPRKPKRKLRDAYVAHVKITILVDMMNPSTIADAATAVGKLKDALPPGAIFDAEARMGKIEA